MPFAADPNETKLAKLSLAGVAGFDGGRDVVTLADCGVDLPDVGDGRMLEKSEPELMGGGFCVPLGLEVQSRPVKSSMVFDLRKLKANRTSGNFLY